MNKKFFSKYLFYPVLLGASGFTAVILLFAAVRLINFLMGRIPEFHLQKTDLIYGCVAFFLVGTIEYLKNFKHRQIL